MKNKLLTFSLPLIIVVSLFSFVYGQTSPDVDEQEIRGLGDRVEFQNRSNTLAPDYIRASQRERGRRFAEQVLQSRFAASEGILIKRILDQNNPGLGADVLVLSEDSDFGHINGIIRIISGYLSESFEYNQADARMLANIIVYYNANIRKNADAIKDRYSKAVVENIDSNRVGIDQYFVNWAGQTEILIPLRSSLVRPGEKDMDASELQDVTKDDLDKATAKKLEDSRAERRKEDKGRLKDLKKEIVKDEKEIDKQKKAVEKKQKAAEQEQDRSKKREEEQQKKAEAAKKELDKEQAKPKSQQDQDKIDQLEKEKAEAAKKAEEERKRQSELDKQKEELDKQKEELDKKSEENKETVKKIEQQEEDIRAEEKGEKTSDQKDKQIEVLEEEKKALEEEKERKEQTTPNVVGEKILFMRIVRSFDNGHYSNELWMIDPVKDESLFRSNYNKICGREFLAVGTEGILVIGYEGSAEQQNNHKFVLLEQSSLSAKKYGDYVIHWLSPMIYKENKIYAFEIFEGKTYLSTFNSDLTLDKRSSDPISPYSEVSFYYDKIYLTGKSPNNDNPEIMVLKKEDLQVLKVIKPTQK